MTVRTRFAPSPTGSLHIGNVRSGLFAYLYARHHHGQFILRIDDTDRERSTKQSLEEILADLKWLGMEWDEGPPDAAYFQTNRVDRHREAALQLLRERKAYPCYCSAEELDAKRKQAEREHRRPVYDRKCRGLDFPADLPLPDKAAGRNYTIRFAMPLDGETVVDDLVKGRMVFQNSELDDFIIVRSDGSPIYNFASILDDVDMRITHIVRGDDHVSNTPRQMQMAYALGFHAAGLRAFAAGAGARRIAAVQAPRRDFGDRVSRERIFPRGDAELPRRASDGRTAIRRFSRRMS